MVYRSFLVLSFVCGVFFFGVASAEILGQLPAEARPGQAENGMEFSFTGTAALPGATVAHTATPLANGDVLVVGGYGKLFGLPLAVSFVRIYEHQKHTWRAAGGSGKYGRLHHRAIRLGDSKVLIVGGRGQDRKKMRTIELFDSATEEFQLVGRMAAARTRPCLNLLPKGTVLITGGGKTAEIVEPGTEHPSGYVIRVVKERSFFHHSDHTATLLADGTVLLAGGRSNGMERFDPRTETFIRCGARLPVYLDDQASAVLYDGRVLLAGGQEIFSNRSVAETWIYDPKSDTLTEGPSLKPTAGGIVQPGGSDLMALDLFAGDEKRRGQYILLCGGEYDPDKSSTADTVLDSAQVYDARRNRMIDVGPMKYRHDEFAIAPLPAGPSQARVLIIGGYGQGDTFQNVCEIFTLTISE